MPPAAGDAAGAEASAAAGSADGAAEAADTAGAVVSPSLFAGLADVGQQSLHRHILALLGHDLQQDAVLLAGDLIGELISGDLHDHVPGLYSVSLVLDPLGDGALLHGQAQLGHQYFISHLVARLLTCSARA